eukprot:5978584-Prymnesium_polylepis.1
MSHFAPPQNASRPNTRYLYVLHGHGHGPSLYVPDRRHTSAGQARQHGQEKRPCRPARLDEAHR